MSAITVAERHGRKKCSQSRVALAALVMAASLLACKTTIQTRGVEPAGFLGDYSQLREGQGGEEAQLLYTNPGADFSAYDKVMIEPVTIWRESPGLRDVSSEDLQRLASHFEAALRGQLRRDYEIVDRAGPGVLRLRAAITEARGSKVLLDLVSTVIPVGRALDTVNRLATGTHSFVGRAGIEGEVLNSLTDERLLAAVDRRAGDKVLRGVTGTWGDVEDAYDLWAARLRERLAELREP